MFDERDQAEGLRRLVARQRENGTVRLLPRPWTAGVRVVAVTSGKGGVGKSTVVANLALALALRGARVLALDGDLGLANLDQLLGVVPRHTLREVLLGTTGIDEALTNGPLGVQLLAACSGHDELAQLSDEQQLGLFSVVDTLEERFDVLVVDTGAGIGSNAVRFAGAAQDILVVTTAEPPAIRDALAMMKVLARRCRVRSVQLLPNMVKGPAEAAAVHATLQELAARFYDLQVDLVGYVVADSLASRCVRTGTPFVLAFPQSPAARCLATVARRLSSPARSAAPVRGSMQFFWRQIVRQTDP